MTQRDIAKDKEMCAAATSGPWSVWERSDSVQVIQKDGEWSIAEMDGGSYGMWQHNAHFIAEARQALPYYIDNYLDAIHFLEVDKKALEEQDTLIERLRARISELEALLHPNNRPDVRSIPEHDRALETIFREIKEGTA